MMVVFYCVDDDGGLLFNKRRQSMDSVLRKRLLDLVGEDKLTCDVYTAKQFEEKDKLQIVGDENYAGASFIFAEKQEPNKLLPLADKLILFKWNRKYPSDVKLGEIPSDFHLKSAEDFVGSSHDKITQEIYEKTGE